MSLSARVLGTVGLIHTVLHKGEQSLAGRLATVSEPRSSNDLCVHGALGEAGSSVSQGRGFQGSVLRRKEMTELHFEAYKGQALEELWKLE